jgi:putative NIF3 family GTP cyclohydrolase 1 type 2
MHTNWDRAAGGIIDTLAKKVGLRNIRPLGESGNSQIPRIGEISPCTVHTLAAHINSVLDTTGENTLRYSRQFSERIVSTLAVCGGVGASFLAEAVATGADALLTADIRHHEFVDAAARNAILIDAGHGATERPGMAALAQQIRKEFPDLFVSYLD